MEEISEIHFPIVKLDIITKKEAIYYIRKFLDKHINIEEGTEQEKINAKNELAELFLKFYHVPESKRRKQISQEKRRKIFERSKGICEVYECNNPIHVEKQIHHKHPENLGGTKDETNLTFICDSCHDKINKFQRKCQEEVCKLLFESAADISIDDPKQVEILEKVNNLQKDFFNKYKFKHQSISTKEIPTS